MQGAFFFLLQSEEGDLYKVTIEHEEEEVRAVKIKYFDTVPVASSLCILKSGFLFVASEFGNQYVRFFLRKSHFFHILYLAIYTSSRSSVMMTMSRSSARLTTPASEWLILQQDCQGPISGLDRWITYSLLRNWNLLTPSLTPKS